MQRVFGPDQPKRRQGNSLTGQAGSRQRRGWYRRWLLVRFSTTATQHCAECNDARRTTGLFHAADALAELVDLGDAPSCHVCGSIMVRNGSCYKCMNCGSTSGCS